VAVAVALVYMVKVLVVLAGLEVLALALRQVVVVVALGVLPVAMAL
jgi:hypothetical protein